MMINYNIVSLNISIGKYLEFITYILELVKNKTSSYICVANVHMCVEAYRDKSFAKLANSAIIITPDGMPLVLALRLLYGIKQDRVAGMDLLPDLLKASEKQGISVYFYGGTQKMLEKSREFCNQQFPSLIIAGMFSPPFRALTYEEEKQVVKDINASGAGLVFVALGCPKQEKWMAGVKGKINACMIGIGGALPVMIGLQKRAPIWMQKASLEWLFRLIQEPKRLFKRYAVTNTVFLYLLFCQWAKQGFKVRPY